MQYRLASVPPDWLDVALFVLEDRTGGLYIFDPEHDRLDRLDPDSANLLVQWYELSQSFAWHTRAEFARMLSSSGARRTTRPMTARGAHDRPRSPFRDGSNAIVYQARENEPAEACA